MSDLFNLFNIFGESKPHKMKALRIVVIILLSLVAIFLIYSATQSGEYRVSRSVEINAPAKTITNYISNLETWEKWSYWNLMDTTNEVTYGETRSGAGASYTWTGVQTGNGEVEILALEDGAKISSMIRFVEPYEDQMNSDFILTEGENGGVNVEWVNYGELPFLMRFMAGGMDAAFGPHLGFGLDSVKAQLERSGSAAPAMGKVLSIEETTVESQKYYYVRHDIPMSEFDSTLMANSFGQLMAYLGDDMSKMTMPPFSMTEEWDKEGEHVILRVCIAADSDLPGNDQIMVGETHEGNVMKATYQGPYEGMEMAYEELMAEISNTENETAGFPWEVYMTDPGMESDRSLWITEIYFPVQN